LASANVARKRSRQQQIDDGIVEAQHRVMKWHNLGSRRSVDRQ
jgi:hypothetical protein